MKATFPPTEPDKIRSRYSSVSKASRVHQGLENYVNKMKRFYAERQEREIVYELDTSFDFSSEDCLEDCKELVRSRVAGQTFDELR